MTASCLEQGRVLLPTDEKETWCLESRKIGGSELYCFFFLTHSVNTVGEGKDGRMLSGEKPGVWRKDF